MGSGALWGILLIVIGLTLIIKVIFNVDIPIFKIIVAFLFIYFGIKILLGNTCSIFKEKSDENTVVFGEKIFFMSLNNKEYNVVFGKAVFDWQHIQLDTLRQKPLEIKINTIFGSSEMILPTDVNVHIDASAVFGSAILPNGNTATFGSTSYVSSINDKPIQLYIKSDVVFGSFRVK